MVEREGGTGRDDSYELPDYAEVHKQATTKKNMTIVLLWSQYFKSRVRLGLKAYSSRQYCQKFGDLCDANDMALIVVLVEILHYNQIIYAEGMLSTKEPEWIVFLEL